MTLRETERASIEGFLRKHSRLFQNADVLDWGCGAQPYRALIEGEGARYLGVDDSSFPAFVAGATDLSAPWLVTRGFDVVLSTQVIQYVEPLAFLDALFYRVNPGGVLMLTGPTNWPIVETADLYRYTPNGIERLLGSQGFENVSVEWRGGDIQVGNERFPLGWGALAWRPAE